MNCNAKAIYRVSFVNILGDETTRLFAASDASFVWPRAHTYSRTYPSTGVPIRLEYIREATESENVYGIPAEG